MCAGVFDDVYAYMRVHTCVCMLVCVCLCTMLYACVCLYACVGSPFCMLKPGRTSLCFRGVWFVQVYGYNECVWVVEGSACVRCVFCDVCACMRAHLCVYARMLVFVHHFVCHFWRTQNILD